MTAALLASGELSDHPSRAASSSRTRSRAMSELQLIPARQGVAARVRQGQTVKVINTHGTQVVDTWAFDADEFGEFMSMEHSRAHMLKLRPQVGDSLLTNLRRPILTLTE